jgi:hypothetical protein
MDRRYQTLTVLGAAAALVFGFAPKDSHLPVWVVYGVSGALLLAAIGTWWHSGQAIGRLSQRVAFLERDINGLVDMSATSGPALQWETGQQGRTGINKALFGEGIRPNGV